MAPADRSLRWSLAGTEPQRSLLDDDVDPMRELREVEYLHVRARSIISEVPRASRMPFRYTINPYRGCSHACTYCFARPTHEYLGLNGAEDFERRIVVKVNAVERLAAELARPSWGGEHIAMGTNTDPYQQCEGRYRLTRGIVETLGAARNPFSILTKSTMMLRDLDVLRGRRPSAPTCASTSRSARSTRRSGASASPARRRRWRRVEAVARLNEAGVPCGVLVAPILPGLSDGESSFRGRARLHRGRRASRSRASRCTCGPAYASSSCPGWSASGPTSWCATEALQCTQRLSRARGAGAHLCARPRTGASGTAVAPGARSTPGGRGVRSRGAAAAPPAPPHRSCARRLRPGLALPRDAVAESRHAVLRARRATPRAACSTATAGACTTTHGRIRRRYATQALDRVPARVPRLATLAAAAARAVHRTVLPRRGDGDRRRAPAVRALPARGLRAASARSGVSSIRARRGADAIDAQLHERACRRPGRARSDITGAVRRPPRRRVRAARRRAWLVLGSQLLRWTPAGYGERRPRPRATTWRS